MGPASWAMPRSSTPCPGSRWGRSTVWTWINLVHIWSISAGFCVLWSPLCQGTCFAVSDGTGHMKRRLPDATIEYSRLSPICMKNNK